jgi:hypothetical protein
MSYSAIVCRIRVHPHPKADRLQLGTAYGAQVVVGLDAKDGDLGIFFPCDGQLSDKFCNHNDLYPRFDEQGRRIGGGFFDPKNRRVRAQGFRGEKSEGFWCPISYLDGMLSKESIALLKDGDQFTDLDGVNICSRYETEATKVAGAANCQKPIAAKKHPLFKEHADTKQFAYEVSKIPVGSVVHISEKLHGTSGRYAFFREKHTFTGWRKYVFAFIGFLAGVLRVKDVAFTSKRLLVGSRRVQLKSALSETSFYGDENFRFAVANGLKEGIRMNETIYGELVGYQKPGSPIMGSVQTAQLNDKEFQKKYGDTITYKYGCPDGVSRFYIYRITQTNEHGYVVDLTVPQIKARCKALGFDYVPELSGPLLVAPGSEGLDRMGLTHPLIQSSSTGTLQRLETLVEGFLDGPSTLDDSHIREGVVVRVDAPNGDTYFLKAKSFAFKVLEGIVKDTGAVDLEECS